MSIGRRQAQAEDGPAKNTKIMRNYHCAIGKTQTQNDGEKRNILISRIVKGRDRTFETVSEGMNERKISAREEDRPTATELKGT